MCMPGRCLPACKPVSWAGCTSPGQAPALVSASASPASTCLREGPPAAEAAGRHVGGHEGGLYEKGPAAAHRVGQHCRQGGPRGCGFHLRPWRGGRRSMRQPRLDLAAPGRAYWAPERDRLSAAPPNGPKKQPRPPHERRHTCALLSAGLVPASQLEDARCSRLIQGRPVHGLPITAPAQACQADRTAAWVQVLPCNPEGHQQSRATSRLGLQD